MESRYALVVVPPNKVGFVAYNTSLLPNRMPGSYVIPNFLNRWPHLAATWDGGAVRLYVDGSQVQAGSFSGTISVPAGSPFFINRHNWSDDWSSRLQGAVDDVAVFSRALSPSEIMQLYSDTDHNGRADFWDTSPPPVP